MQDHLKLNAEKIFNKDFSIDFKGYSPQEIDEFLDVVIKDYQIAEKVLDEMFDENRRLKYQVATLEAEIIELKAGLAVNENSNDSSNIDILKRLARLEEVILKK